MALTENGGMNYSMPLAPAYGGGYGGGFGFGGDGFLWILLILCLGGGWGGFGGFGMGGAYSIIEAGRGLIPLPAFSCHISCHILSQNRVK